MVSTKIISNNKCSLGEHMTLLSKTLQIKQNSVNDLQNCTLNDSAHLFS